jgi:glyoxylase-like metal-dependent hydrolase (beta-lactamase superfamily II)
MISGAAAPAARPIAFARREPVPFLEEPEPVRGEPHAVADGVLRLVARNPSQMTYWGTNTYLMPGLMPGDDGFVVLDPGPATDEIHVEDIRRATQGRISAILISHGHSDHLGALERLRRLCDAPVHAFHQPIQRSFTPDVPLRDGDRIGPLTALHTPGHAADHLCFARDDGLVFTADHVMGWSSSVVSPPGGDMAAYVASLQRLIDRDDPLYLPGHGPAIGDPRAYVVDLRERRIAREREILGAVRGGPMSILGLRERLYSKTDPFLQSAAERNVLAHLLKLQAEGAVAPAGDGLWRAA